MSDENHPEAQAAGAKPGGKGKLLLLVGVALLLLLVGGGAGAYFMLAPAGGEEAVGHAEPAVEDPADIVFVDLPDLLINLRGGDRRLRFLKIATAVEVRGEEQAEIVRQFVPRILDSFHMYLRAVSPEELEGSEGVYRIKEALLTRTNEAVKPAEVRNVLIREMLVQ
jgi:flagellar FliL protein